MPLASGGESLRVRCSALTSLLYVGGPGPQKTSDSPSCHSGNDWRLLFGHMWYVSFRFDLFFCFLALFHRLMKSSSFKGCPEPNEKHAVVMSRFAGECLVEMERVIQDQLVDILGTETASLKLRVGLHSGSVTAGVLRGERLVLRGWQNL